MTHTGLACDCHGKVHRMCVPLMPPLQLIHATQCCNTGGRGHTHYPEPAPPPLLRDWDCGCNGTLHVVCGERWHTVKTLRPLGKTWTSLTLRQALKQGLKIRPHLMHVYICPPGCGGTAPYHVHACPCSWLKNGLPTHTRTFQPHELGQTIREPVEAT